MTFKTYNMANAPHKVAPKPSKRLTLSIRDNGVFILARALHERMGKPSGIVILQDTQYPADFYLKSSADPQAFKVKPGSKNQFRVVSNTMAGIIGQALNLTPPLEGQIHFVRKGGRTLCRGYNEAHRTNPEIGTTAIVCPASGR